MRTTTAVAALLITLVVFADPAGAADLKVMKTGLGAGTVASHSRRNQLWSHLRCSHSTTCPPPDDIDLEVHEVERERPMRGVTSARADHDTDPA